MHQRLEPDCLRFARVTALIHWLTTRAAVAYSSSGTCAGSGSPVPVTSGSCMTSASPATSVFPDCFACDPDCLSCSGIFSLPAPAFLVRTWRGCPLLIDRVSRQVTRLRAPAVARSALRTRTRSEVMIRRVLRLYSSSGFVVQRPLLALLAKAVTPRLLARRLPAPVSLAAPLSSRALRASSIAAAHCLRA